MAENTKSISWVMRSETSNIEMLIEKFVNMLNPKSIKEFNKACKEKHLEIKNQYKIEGDTSKLNRSNFNSIMKNIFNNKAVNPDEIDFEPIFDLIFKRFKIVKYDIKSENIKYEINQKYNEKDIFIVNDVIPEEREIDVFEIAIALSIYIKCDFKEKIRLLFDITDVDEDGYINENEIRNMITTVNFIFSDEESLISSNSSIVNQSLASIKSQQIFNMIMKYPGELSKIITTEKYVHFDQFYDSITKIIDYKYCIIPIFVDMKTSIYKQKVEPEYEVEKRNVNEFLSIANEIVSNVKIGNNEYIKNNQDMKKIMEHCRNEREKKSKRAKNVNSTNKLNFNNNNINIINNNTNEGSNNEFGGQWVSLNKENNSNSNAGNTNSLNCNNTFKKDNKQNTNNKKLLNDLEDTNSLKKNVSNIINRNFMYTANEGNKVNLNKISNLEAQPGKIRIKENTNVIRDLMSMKTDNTNSQGKIDLNIFLLDTLTKFEGNNKKGYKGNMSLADIMQEIRAIANKHNSDNDHDSEEVLKNYIVVKELASSLKNRLHSNTKTSFSLFDYKPRKNDY